MKSRLMAMALAAGLCVALTAQADAHSRINHRFLRGYYGEHAVVTGTVISSTDTSFTADAYVITPGSGDSSTTPTETQVTITPGTGTKILVNGQQGAAINTIATGDTFYAVYQGVSSSADITTITGGTPSFVTAFLPPTPKFVVEGTITTAPTTGNPDQFTATAEIVQPCSHGQHGFGRYRGRHDGEGYGYSCRIDGFWNGSGVGGDYGYSSRHRLRGQDRRGQHWDGNSGSGTATTPTTGVVITVDANTKFTVDGNHSATVADLAVGQHFVAVFDGSPSTASLSSLPPALSVCAHTVYERYGFVGTVASTDTVDTPNTVTVDVTGSMPSGMFSGSETFTIGSDTRVYTMSGPSLADIAPGDTVAGGVIAPAGETTTQIEGTALGFLVDPPHWSGHHVRRHTEMARLRKLLRTRHGHIRR